MEAPLPPAKRPFEIPRELPWLLLGVLLALELYRRLFLGHIPHDFGAYLAAGDTFARGLDPYGEAIFESPLYQGYPYIYPPATLYGALLLAKAPAILVVALDAILRFVILIVSVIFLRRRLELESDLSPLLFGACFFAPFAFDLMTGNLETYMFFGLIILVDSKGRSLFLAVLAGLGAGWLFSIKPMWFIPAVAALIALRAWPALAGLIAAASAALALSLSDPDLVSSWLVRVAEVREFYEAVNFLELSHVLYILVILAWIGVGLWIMKVRGASEEIWVYACTSLVIWPRSDLYSYMIFLPVLFYLWRRLGGLRGIALFIPLVGPAPWVLASYERVLSLTVLLVWACIITAVVATLMIRSQSMASNEDR